MFYIRGASFWQQNQSWRLRQASLQQDLDVTSSLAGVMGSALTKLSSGMAAIANQKALTRVQTQIKAATAAVQSVPSGTTGGSVNKIA